MIRRHARPLAINILPEEYRKRYLTRRESGLLALLLIGLAALALVYPRLSRATDQSAALRAEERRSVAATRALAPRVQQGEQLRQEIAGLQAQLAKTRKERAVALAPRLNWEALLAGVLVSTPRGIELTSIESGSRQLVVEGASYEGFSALESYYGQLTRTPGIAKATINRTALREDKSKFSYLAFKLTLTLTGD